MGVGPGGDITHGPCAPPARPDGAGSLSIQGSVYCPFLLDSRPAQCGIGRGARRPQPAETPHKAARDHRGLSTLQLCPAHAAGPLTAGQPGNHLRYKAPLPEAPTSRAVRDLNAHPSTALNVPRSLPSDQRENRRTEEPSPARGHPPRQMVLDTVLPTPPMAPTSEKQEPHTALGHMPRWGTCHGGTLCVQDNCRGWRSRE